MAPSLNVSGSTPYYANLTVSVNGIYPLSRSTVTFAYSTLSPITQTLTITPLSVVSGMTVTVYGSNFTSADVCKFGVTLNSGSTSLLSTSALMCVVPTMAHLGTVTVTVGTRAGTVMYVSEPAVVSVSPKAGSIAGGYAVTLTGAGFGTASMVSKIKCFFGPFESVPVTAWLSATAIVCTVPPGPSASSVTLSVVVDQITSVTSVSFTYVLQRASLISLSPTVGVRGTLVTATLLGNATDCDRAAATSYVCMWDGSSSSQASLISGSALQIQCSALGSNLTIQGVAGWLGFSLCNSSSVSHVVPDIIMPSVVSTAGIALTVFGSSFYNTSTLCGLFKGHVYPASFKSQSVVTMTLPASIVKTLPWGPSNVSVSSDGTDFGVPGTVLIAEVPTLMSITIPLQVPIRSSPVITLFGSGFLSQHNKVASIKFGTANAPVRVVSSTSITCTVPSSNSTTVAPVNITFAVLGNDVSVSIGALQYVAALPISVASIPSPAPPTVSRVYPLRIHPGSATTLVTLVGDMFSATSSVLLDDVPVSLSAFYSSKVIVCSIPAQDPAAAGKYHLLKVANDQSNFISAPSIPLLFLDEVTVSSVSPATGQGSQWLSINGSGFLNVSDLACRIGSFVTSRAMFVSSTTCQCWVPAGLVPDSYPISITVNGRDYFAGVASSSVFTAVPLALATSRSVSTSTISGSGFVAPLQCKFGQSSPWLNASITTSGSIVCQTTVQCGALHLSVDGGLTTLTSASVISVPCGTANGSSLILSFLNPPSGPITGGTPVTVHGSGFTDLPDIPACRFGDAISSAAVLLSDTELLCVAPSATVVGPVLVGLVAESFVVPKSLTYNFTMSAPYILSVAPSASSPSGGSVVTFTGSSFAGSALCIINATIAGPATFASSSLVVGIAPEFRIPGPASVVVGTSSALPLSSSHSFNYRSPMTISSVAPFGGYAGTIVTITGTGFNDSSDPTVCLFGTAVATTYVVSDTQVTCVAPHDPLPPGRISLTLSSSILPASSWPNATFTYLQKASLLFVAIVPPVSVLAHQGFDIIGSSFDDVFPVFVRLGSSTITQCSRTSSSSLTCEAPNGVTTYPSGVTVSVAFGSSLSTAFITTSLVYVRLPNPTVTVVTPSLVPLRGGSQITVLGSGFSPRLNLSCRFVPDGASPILPAVVINSTALLCVSPSGLPSLTSIAVRVRVDYATEFGGGASSTFTVYDDRISLIVPTTGPWTGGTNVRVYLRSVPPPSAVVICRFTAPAAVLLSTAPLPVPLTSVVNCPTPNFQGPVNDTLLSVSLNGGHDFTSTDVATFSFQNPVVLVSASPARAPANIAVFGSGFLPSPGLLCSFGNGIVNVSAVWISSTHIQCRAPSIATASSAVQLAVTNNGLDYSPSTLSIAVDSVSATALSVTPPLGQIGSVVSVYGSGFLNSTSLACSFGTSTVRGSATFHVA